MKNNRKIAGLIGAMVTLIMLCTFSSFKTGGDDDQGIIVIRVVEVQKGSGCLGGKDESKIYLVNPDGTSEETVIERFDSSTAISNMQAIAKELNKVYTRGYRLKSTSSGLWQCSMITHYIFEK